MAVGTRPKEQILHVKDVCKYMDLKIVGWIWKKRNWFPVLQRCKLLMIVSKKGGGDMIKHDESYIICQEMGAGAYLRWALNLNFGG